MAVLMVPPTDPVAWPTLGPQVCAWIEGNLVHGPGDLRGEPARLTEEKRLFVYRAYEVFPQGHERAGRRRFKRVLLCLRKGTAKSEFAAWIAAVELAADGPVRCVGWDEHGQPIGGPVTDPYIPLVATTEDQSAELVYGALKAILELAPNLANKFDVGEERVMRPRGDGKAAPLATSPNSRDGARTTFQVFDESHRLIGERMLKTHQTMLQNVPKRYASDAWTLEVTTAPTPGEGSVAEASLKYAEAVRDGRVADPDLFAFYRYASDQHDLSTPDGLMAAIVEASGPNAAWSDLHGIAASTQDPEMNFAYFRRVWLNQRVQAARQAFDADRWRRLARPGHEIAPGGHVVLGFKGSRYAGATALVATEVLTGHQALLGIWERPLQPNLAKGWEAPADEVEAAVMGAFERWSVWRMYADPYTWESALASWSGDQGRDERSRRVVTRPTNATPKFSASCRAFAHALVAGDISHDGSAALARHVGAVRKRELPQVDEQGQPLWTATKDRPDSTAYIDAAVAAILSWDCRRDALAEGVGREEASIYTERAASGCEELIRWL